MTFKSVDLQVSVPRAGEVERIQRTVQDQQQTDKQIVGEAVRENLHKQTRMVKETKGAEQKKVREDAPKKEGQGDRQKKKRDNSPKGKHLDLKI